MQFQNLRLEKATIQETVNQTFVDLADRIILFQQLSLQLVQLLEFLDQILHIEITHILVCRRAYYGRFEIVLGIQQKPGPGLSPFKLGERFYLPKIIPFFLFRFILQYPGPGSYMNLSEKRLLLQLYAANVFENLDSASICGEQAPGPGTLVSSFYLDLDFKVAVNPLFYGMLLQCPGPGVIFVSSINFYLEALDITYVGFSQLWSLRQEPGPGSQQLLLFLSLESPNLKLFPLFLQESRLYQPGPGIDLSIQFFSRIPMGIFFFEFYRFLDIQYWPGPGLFYLTFNLSLLRWMPMVQPLFLRGDDGLRQEPGPGEFLQGLIFPLDGDGFMRIDLFDFNLLGVQEPGPGI